jgi:AcrR family transcriptional regulator
MSGKDEAHMDVPGMDRRVQRTRTALINAFTELLLGQGYEELTVAQVAQRADVGRSTLYEHFRTKEDLLKAAVAGPFAILAGAVCPEADPQALVRLLDHFRSNYAVSRILLAQPMRSRIARVLAGQIAGHLQTAGVRGAVPGELAAIAIAEGQLALVEHWLSGYPALSADAIAQALRNLARPFASSFE